MLTVNSFADYSFSIQQKAVARVLAERVSCLRWLDQTSSHLLSDIDLQMTVDLAERSDFADFNGWKHRAFADRWH